MVGNVDIGRQLLNNMSSSFLKIGITFASLSLSGIIPVSSDWLIKIVKLSLI